MSRISPPIAKTVLACAGFVLSAMSCERHRNRENIGLTPVPAAPLSSTAPVVASSIPPLSSQARTEDEKNTIAVFRAAARSTVFVTEREIIVDYDRREAEEVPAGSGTGFVWDRQGHVVTNFHVVMNAHSLAVTLQDHRSFEAEVVGTEPKKDIAVLLIKAPPDALFPIQVPPTEARLLEVGQKAIAIGNPFGLDQTLTTGVVSAIGRSVKGVAGVSIRDMIQTDAAINPGNSGGPLLDSSGRLIGMNTMIFSRSGSSAGIGFAVPVSTIARIVPQIIRTGRAEQIGLGIKFDPEQQLERSVGISGVVVIGVIPDSPAAKAGLVGLRQEFDGLKLGDVIVAIDGQRVASYDALYTAIDKHRAGDKVEVTTVREGRPFKAVVPLVPLP